MYPTMTPREDERSAGSHPGNRRAETELTAAAASVAAARAFVVEHCRQADLPPGACDTAALLTSEVVTNAFLHGRSNAHLRVDISPLRMRVEVGDDNVRPPQLAEPQPEATNGRGLLIVDALATDWGVHTTQHGKSVWFEIADGPHS